VAQQIKCWICDQQIVGLNCTWGKSCITTLGKLFTPMRLCHQAVYIGTGQGAVMQRGWEGKAWWKVMAACCLVDDL